MALNIRKPLAYDIEEVVDLARAMSDESEAYRKKGFDRERTTNVIGCFCFRQENCIGYVAENEEGKIVGMIGLVLMPNLTHNVMMATDIGVFVHPAYRGSSAAIRLIKAAEQEAIALGADEIHLGVSTGVLPERTVDIYSRLGYKLHSYGMVKETK